MSKIWILKLWQFCQSSLKPLILTNNIYPVFILLTNLIDIKFTVLS